MPFTYLRRAAAAIATSCLALTAAASPHTSLQGFRLDNGLQVYLHEDHRAPIISAQLWYHVGSSHEPEGHSGLTHALEHLIFEGTRKLTADQYKTLLARLGSEANAFTTADATVFYQTLPASRLEIALEVMADSMQNATLGEADFARELQVIKAERRTEVEDSPMALAMERIHALAYGHSPYATPVIGYRQYLEDLSLATLRVWYQTWYHPNNATLVIVGDTTLEALQALVERHFGTLSPAPLRSRDPVPPSDAPGERRLVIAQAGLGERLVMAFNTPSLFTAGNTEDALALSLVPQLLSEGVNARLRKHRTGSAPTFQYLRAEYTLVQQGDSLLTLIAVPNSEQHVSLEDAEASIWEAIESLQYVRVDEHELRRAKARQLAERVFAADDLAAQGRAIGSHAVSGVPPERLEDDRQALQNLTALRLQQAAQHYLTRDRVTVAYLRNEEKPNE
ncbi:insulinase family protein [Pseudomonas capeferrum]|uniref:M16 family metallopeptidase n=1 Tax=Pseudomonas capeferrum TaxID=1495066 RepID=UPI0015E459C1|nr:pitrilysin family protein [Pseudomonas capeferrum]MBA1202325.1 insulinase family protein [Pseudomonas capeferrum]